MYCTLSHKTRCWIFAITSSTVNRFWKFFHYWNSNKWSTTKMWYFSPSLRNLVALPCETWKLKKLHLLQQFLTTKLCRTFMITVWIVNWFEKNILRIWATASLLQWPLTRIPYCQSSKCPPLACTPARRRACHQLRYQLHSVESRAKCPTVPQRHELVTDTHAAVQGSK